MRHRIRVAAIVLHEDRVLLVSTKKGAPGHLVPPGGGVEAGESLAQAVAREVLEEAGLVVQPGSLIAYRELTLPHGLALELYFVAHLDAQSPPETATEGREIRWLGVDELDRTPHFPEQLRLLCRLVEGNDPGARYLGAADLRGIGES